MELYSAPPSYYSMIARLALNESHTPFNIRRMDIHIAKDQLSPWYRAINPGMTVPTLIEGDRKWIDSREILKFAAKNAADEWVDADLTLSPHIEKIVNAHYNISIEDLTFGKAMCEHKLLRKIFPRMLNRINKQLEEELKTNVHQDAIKNKIAVNQKRLSYFSQGDQLQKLNDRRQDVRDYINHLPHPKSLLFGDKPSSADIVTAVFFARLTMIGEEDLINSVPVLLNWFNNMKTRPAFVQSDIWLKFNPWRILLKY